MRWKKGEFAVVDNATLIDVDAVHDYLHEAHWAKGRSKMVVHLAIERSLSFGLLEGDRTIGFARVITDFAVVGIVEDVYVLPEFQGQGLGRWMMECILSHPALTGIELILESREVQGFYEKLGFHVLDDATEIMRRSA
jgi:GNAT superfamily N-acetyltransferase